MIKPVSFRQVDFTGGFWKKRQEINREKTASAVLERFRETGRLAALSCKWKEGEEGKPHVYWDSDVAKWIEGAAYLLEKQPSAELELECEALIDAIEQNQREDGYYNSHFLTICPEDIFTRRNDHELYCCGHLIEAAIAYHQATGKDRFLKIMRKYADLVCRIFVEEKSAPYFTPGHEELELALVKLYRYTGEKRYLKAASYFVLERGKHGERLKDKFTEYCAQDHLPVLEMDEAQGHAVRMTYLLCAMADVALEENNKELLAACKRLLENIVTKKMYITGGIGSTKDGEAFTMAYDLPAMEAYSETCAAIGMMLFCRRMQLLENDGLYADVIERELYNAFPSGVSLDGESFFYTNPLALEPKLRGKNITITGIPTNLPITQRVHVFSCSCCPPNVLRTVASIGDLLYTRSGDTLMIHQYAQSKAELEGFGRIEQTTDYPWDEDVTITLTGMAGKKAAVRIPGWCREYTLTVNGKSVSQKPEKGYITLPVEADETVISLHFAMPVRLMEADPRVLDATGKAALCRGPIVFCAEGVDNGGDLDGLYLNSKDLAPIVERDDTLELRLTVGGLQHERNTTLYADYADAKFTPCRIKLIPYFTFANREESPMAVWLPVK